MTTSDCGNDDITESSTFVPIEQTTVRPPTNYQMLRGQPRSNRKMKIIYEQTATSSDGANLAAFKAVDATYEYSDSSNDEKATAHIGGHKVAQVQQRKAKVVEKEQATNSLARNRAMFNKKMTTIKEATNIPIPTHQATIMR